MEDVSGLRTPAGAHRSGGGVACARRPRAVGRRDGRSRRTCRGSAPGGARSSSSSVSIVIPRPLPGPARDSSLSATVCSSSRRPSIGCHWFSGDSGSARRQRRARRPRMLLAPTRQCRAWIQLCFRWSPRHAHGRDRSHRCRPARAGGVGGAGEDPARLRRGTAGPSDCPCDRQAPRTGPPAHDRPAQPVGPGCDGWSRATHPPSDPHLSSLANRGQRRARTARALSRACDSQPQARWPNCGHIVSLARRPDCQTQPPAFGGALYLPPGFSGLPLQSPTGRRGAHTFAGTP